MSATRATVTESAVNMCKDKAGLTSSSATRATLTESAVSMCEGEAGLTSKALLGGGHGDAAQDGRCLLHCLLQEGGLSCSSDGV